MSDMEESLRTCERARVDTDGISYISCSETSYLSLNYHRSQTSTKHEKACWDVPREDECHCFCESEIHQWVDPKGNLWYVSDGGSVILGKDGERLAFFDEPENDGDPWHGFPVSGRRGGAKRLRPPQSVLDKWLSSSRISKVMYDRIMTGRI